MLPKIEYPIYEIKLISFDKPVKFRPFLVKEQKLLMMAIESGEPSVMTAAVKQIISNCCLEEIDVDELPMVDVENFYINLRARSVGEVVDLFYRCKNIVEGTECSMTLEINVDLLKDVQYSEQVDSIVKLSNDVGVKLRMPTVTIMESIENLEENLTENLIIDCIEQIFTEEEVYNVKEATREELEEFIQSLSTTDYGKLEKFVEKSPKLKYEKEHSCPKCGFVHKIKLEGINDFFM